MQRRKILENRKEPQEKKKNNIKNEEKCTTQEAAICRQNDRYLPNLKT